MDTPISRGEHEEFCKRIEEENKRQNKRIEILEDVVKQISLISISVEKLAVNMENMLKEQVEQGNRLKVLEERDGEMWRKAIGYVMTTIIGIIIGYIFMKLGF